MSYLLSINLDYLTFGTTKKTFLKYISNDCPAKKVVYTDFNVFLIKNMKNLKLI